jgi:hypothetical protein
MVRMEWTFWTRRNRWNFRLFWMVWTNCNFRLLRIVRVVGPKRIKWILRHRSFRRIRLVRMERYLRTKWC